MKIKFLFLLLLFVVSCMPKPSMELSGSNKRPDGFIDIEHVIPGILLDIRYYSDHNFLGEKVDGYLAPKCYLTKEAAQALSAVQNDLRPHSLTLKIYDCYRPQRAVDHFVRWAGQIENPLCQDSCRMI